MNVLVLGANGMLGHMIYSYLKEQGYNVVGTARNGKYEYEYDAFESMESLEEIIKNSEPSFVINCIGILNKVAEDNHYLATKINSLLPNYIDTLSEKYNFKFIHVSTDCVFSGKKGNYDESSLTDATSFYGRSKALGEINNDRNLTLRTSIVGPDINEKGIGLYHWFMNQHDSVNGFTKAIWSGVTTLELSKIIEYTFNSNMTGLHHVVNNDSISKYDLLKLFAKYSDKDIKINPYDDFVENKSLVNTSNEFIDLIPSYEKMVEEMCEWIKNHNDVYTYEMKRKTNL